MQFFFVFIQLQRLFAGFDLVNNFDLVIFPNITDFTKSKIDCPIFFFR